MAADAVILAVVNYFVPATVFAILALGLNVQWGETGLFNAGVAAFYGMGAYVFGMMATGFVAGQSVGGIPITPGHWGPPFPLDLLLSAAIAMAFTAAIGILVAIPTIRLRADYLAIATLAFAEIVRTIFKNETRLTGGDQSLSQVPRPFQSLVPLGPISDGLFLIILMVVAFLLFLVLNQLYRGAWGRALKTVREDEEAAEALGKDTFRLKLAATGIGCAIMGLAGVFEASYATTVSPQQFVPFTTFSVYVMVVLGGSGNNKGVIVGAYLFYTFQWAAQQVKALPGIPSDWSAKIDYIEIIVTGLLLILFILFRPSGVLPEKKYVPPEAATR